MDELAGGMGSHNNSGGPPLGPGSGNNNGGGGGGGGGGGLRQPQPQQQQPPPLTLQGQEGELQRPQYTIPGILHYIQHEWARFEMERAHWEVEKAELQARIAFLQGERKGQENLKKDLVRRIKMLEYALKQERAKYHKLKYGTELNQGDLKMPAFESEETKDTEVPSVPQNSQLTWKQGRQLLRQYLQEVGYTDTILDVRSQRVRSLLGLSGSEQNGSVETKNLEQILNGGDSPSKQKGQEVKRNSGDKPRVADAETFNFLENADDDSDEDDEEEGDMVEDITDGKEKHRINKKHKVKIGNEGLAADLPDDPDTEEALKEFDFLVTTEDGEGAGEARSSGDGTEWAEPLTFPSGTGKSFIMGSDDVLESVLGLGDLADLTVANDADFSYDLPSNKDAFRKTWNPKYTLRSHFDGVRSLAFHPVEPVLVTASEDHTLKLWNLQKTVPAKKSASLDVEPIYTFRAHIGPVLSLAVSPNGEQCFSGGIDATIRCWNMPSPNVDPYDTYDPNVILNTLVAHKDAVWGLSFSGIKNRLLSCSADGTIRLWNPTEKTPCLSTYNVEKENGIPTSVDFVGADPAQVVSSFNTGNTTIYDLETSQPLVKLESQVDAASPLANQINRVVSHPTLPVTITAHEDRHIKFFDNKTGKLIHAMVAHLDAVTSLAVDPNGIYLMSGSHDCSIRLWNLDSKTCVQEITAHRKKCDESIYDVAFHPSKAYIASAGADALAKVFV
ncbi:striatin-3 isoform X4 [Callorhinchus milii]|uniref:striatin-3 isoform X4 n=1 Tax=Callorhinchus milii TaxID=7868 RepID=UPI0004575EA5|nr:striatin-3 isoform X4 [Callorhinchus milii]|eukprot:gi/632951978/ref/XP_007891593.1/ PREDICTED: striatin-3 isoform X1 [Callorhinchus milii]